MGAIIPSAIIRITGPRTPGLSIAISPRLENWEVQRLQSKSKCRVVLFAPKMTTPDAVKAAVPDLLLADDYKNLYRVWLLVQNEVGGTPCWRLLSKTRLIGEVSEFCRDNLISASYPNPNQKVYGATREMSDRLGSKATYIEGVNY